jgi:antitoxin ParD1/3/4
LYNGIPLKGALVHISLTPELEQIIKAKVESGFYNNASEVVREALRFMQSNSDLVQQMKMTHLRNELLVAEKEIKDGYGTTLKNKKDVSELFDDIKK